MKFPPESISRVLIKNDATPEELRAEFDSLPDRFKLECPDEARLGQLAVKFEEYLRRLQISPNKLVVRDAICKLAILEKLLTSDDATANYFDSFDYACEGLEMYGGDLLIESPKESESFMGEFGDAFATLKSYAETGNVNITGGTQLPEID